MLTHLIHHAAALAAIKVDDGGLVSLAAITPAQNGVSSPSASFGSPLSSGEGNLS